ncbi:MAG: MmcQ/YjbR family DNA-binding protein [Thiobacillaceae bacterium]
MTFAAVRKIALALAGVEEASSYGTPAFKVRGTMMARLRPELDALVVLMSMEGREELIAADPETYFITDHYLKYPYVLVNLARVHPDAMQDLLRGAWRSAAAAKKGTKRRGTRGKLDE